MFREEQHLSIVLQVYAAVNACGITLLELGVILVLNELRLQCCQEGTLPHTELVLTLSGFPSHCIH